MSTNLYFILSDPINRTLIYYMSIYSYYRLFKMLSYGYNSNKSKVEVYYEFIMLADGFEDIEALSVVDAPRRGGRGYDCIDKKDKFVVSAHDVPVAVISLLVILRFLLMI